MSVSPISVCADDVTFELNPTFDRLQFAEMFRRNGRIHIQDILTDASAERLSYALKRETPWGFFFNEGGRARELRTVSPEDHQKMVTAAWERARMNFQYIYHFYRLSECKKIFPPPNHYLHRLATFLGAADVCDFVRDNTGTDVTALHGSTATLFSPLHFLTVHDDGDKGDKDDTRLIAFSLNMSPKRRPDWAGTLQFYDRDDHIEEAYLPTFNGLNPFRVPKLHSAGQVAALGGRRYAISGWFGSDKAKPAMAT